MNDKAPPDTLTHDVASFVFRTTSTDLSPSSRESAKRALVNILGCCIGGSRHEIVETAARALIPLAGGQTCTLLGRPERVDVLTAALINALSSAAYSFDDTHSEALLHPSGAVATTLLALAERQRLTGSDFLLSMVLGIEIAGRLSKAVSVPPAQGDIGWSQTGIAAGVGAAAAAAKALRLTSEQIGWAIGIAATQSSGFRAAHGSMSATLIFGHAAQTGLRAAILAQHGFDGPRAPLEGKYGYLSLFSRTPHFEYLLPPLGSPFEVEALAYKPYPCGAVIHPVVNAALQWHHSQGADRSRQIREVRLHTHPSAMALGFRRHPENVLEAKVSLFHWVATALWYGRASIAEGQSQVVQDVRIAQLRDRINVLTDDAIPPESAVLHVLLASGEEQTVSIEHCKGSVMNPMSDDDINEKYYQQALLHISRFEATTMCQRSWRIEELEDAADIIRVAAPSSI
ncbi:MmgE/PrpD family protein [Caballeronia catudaia]|uniref:MmgE/PrpD family protein n=1 Tax=Caballeronia catudaia TaxID=1777136 RepID=A0A158CS59_9BURK|nr:MmgE/PrpD family protein [Caballeronia catudaia]SAK85205.1 MmgE/PrpD family protein [Caballeronia catudaia]